MLSISSPLRGCFLALVPAVSSRDAAASFSLLETGAPESHLDSWDPTGGGRRKGMSVTCGPPLSVLSLDCGRSPSEPVDTPLVQCDNLGNSRDLTREPADPGK